MDVPEAHQYLYDRLDTDPGKFYSAGANLDLGVGQIYSGVRFPLFNVETQLYQTVQGVVYILTHECDIDQQNKRPFNDFVLIAPIIFFENWVTEFQEEYKREPEKVTSFLGRVAKRDVSRVIYLPSVFPLLQYGGLIYLNQITHTHITQFFGQASNRIASVTAYGLEKIDQMIQQHFLRPKDNILALTRR